MLDICMLYNLHESLTVNKSLTIPKYIVIIYLILFVLDVRH